MTGRSIANRIADGVPPSTGCRMRFRPAPFLALVVTAVSLSAQMPAHAGDAAGDGSMRMFRDPQRDVLAAPTDAALREAGPAVEAATGAELREEAVPGPAGGTKVNLRGRMRAAVSRQAGTGGATHECVQESGQAHD
jgi:hypothetical protein